MSSAPVTTTLHAPSGVLGSELHAAASAKAAGRPALPRLTALRGVAALAVFVFHCFGELLFVNDDWNNVGVWLWAGVGEASVACFFMLSGFVLVWVSRPSDTKARFYRRRIVKVYPNHIITWFAGLLVFIAIGKEFNILALLPSLALLQVWMPRADVLQGTNGPAWTLACEMFFYAVFPFLVARVLRIPQHRMWKWAIGLMGIIVAWTLVVAAFVPTTPVAEEGLPVPVLQFYTLIFLPPLRLVDFVLGMLLAHMVLSKSWPAVKLQWVVGALLAGYVLSITLPAPLGYLAPFIPGLFLLIGYASTADLAGKPTLLTSRPMILMGEISFGFYLVHWIVLRNVRMLLGDGPWAAPAVVGYWALCLALSIAFGYALYRFVEMPLVRRYSSPKSVPAATTETVRPPVVPAPRPTPAPAPAGAFATHARAAGADWPPHRETRAPLDPPAIPQAAASDAVD